MDIKNSLLLGLLVLTFSSQIYAEPSSSTNKPPKIGIALSGGGARGLAHIGVLKALEELRVPIDYLAGTSMGSIIGGLYALGYNAQDLEQAVLGIDWHALFTQQHQADFQSLKSRQERRRYFLQLEAGFDPDNNLTTATSVIGSHELFLQLKRLTQQSHNQHFDKLPIPYRAIAADINQAKPIVLEQGDLALAMRASMAVPFIFSPVKWGEHVLVDGGLLNNLPVDVVRNMGANIVIAINISSPLGEVKSSSSFLEIASQSIDAALIQNTQTALQNADLVITPDLTPHSFYDFFEAQSLIKKGYQAIMAKSVLFKSLAATPEQYQLWQNRQHKHRYTKAYHIRDITFTGNHRTSTHLLTNRLSYLNNKVIYLDAIESASRTLMALNDFEKINYAIDAHSDGHSLTFELTEKPWGPHYFRFGFNGFATQDTDPLFQWLFKHEWLNINRFGAELHNELIVGSEFLAKSELYQPLSHSGRWFVAPYAALSRKSRPRFVNDHEIARFIKKQQLIGLDFGIAWNNFSDLRAGLVNINGEEDLDIGDPTIKDLKINDTAIQVRYIYDSLDDPNFARQGTQFKLNLLMFRPAFGEFHNYNKTEIYLRKHFALREASSLIYDLKLNFLYGEDIPAHESFLFGGINDFSGYRFGEIEGTQALIMRLGFMTPLFENPLNINDNLSLLMFGHAGIVWGERLFEDDQAFMLSRGDLGALGALIWDTPLGIVLIGAGISTDGKLRYYLSVGNLFESYP